ncbi:hypothetical protein H6F48_06375 [Limnothrix sp. FACHB-1088]|nr:hypothetical protein [Limnothrix sp. FACHB-1088]
MGEQQRRARTGSRAKIKTKPESNQDPIKTKPESNQKTKSRSNQNQKLKHQLKH